MLKLMLEDFEWIDWRWVVVTPRSEAAIGIIVQRSFCL